MEQKKDFSLINCISTAMIAYFLTIPVHEGIHAITLLIYGKGVKWYSATCVDYYDLGDIGSLPYFHRIMLGGGSASIINVIIGIILMFIVLKVSMGPTVRLFLTQLMGSHLSCGIGYFMIGGIFGAGDWGIVFSCFTDDETFIIVLRIVLAVLGIVGIVFLFFLLNHLSYYFIEDATNKKEKLSVAFKLHIIMLIIGFTVGMITTALSPSDELNLGLGALANMMWVPFFWGFMFTGVMNVLPPKKSRFQYKLPSKLNVALLIIGVALILFDIIVLGPGIHFDL